MPIAAWSESASGLTQTNSTDQPAALSEGRKPATPHASQAKQKGRARRVLLLCLFANGYMSFFLTHSPEPANSAVVLYGKLAGAAALPASAADTPRPARHCLD